MHEGLADIAKRGRGQRPLPRAFVGIRREIDHRNLELRAQMFGRFDAIHVPFQDNIHQDQIGAQLGSFLQGVQAGRSNGRDGIAQTLQALLDIYGNDIFVFNHQNGLMCHTPHPRCVYWSSAKVIVTVVPPLLWNAMVPSNCSVSVCTKRRPRDSVWRKSMLGGKPIPLSLTRSMNRAAPLARKTRRISPALPAGKACFSALATSSWMINPQGMAVSIPSVIWSTCSCKAIAAEPGLYEDMRCAAKVRV